MPKTKQPNISRTFPLRVFLILALAPLFSYADGLTVKIPDNGKNLISTELNYYYTQLITQALEKTKSTDGDFNVVLVDQDFSVNRSKRLLSRNLGADVIWLPSTKVARKQLHEVDVDLLKELYNYRVLIINKSDQERFAQMQSIDELRKLIVGDVIQWISGSLMENSGFEVKYAPNANSLFKMLSFKRFDFVARGLHSSSPQNSLSPGLNLVTEETILLKNKNSLHYCFFVNKHNIRLADRLKRGLHIMQADGSFDRLFYSIPTLKEGEAQLIANKKRIFILANHEAPLRPQQRR